MESTGRKVMCKYCRKKFSKEELIQVNKSTRCCEACYKTQRQESENFKELIDYICKGFNQKAPTGQQLKDIKKFKELGYTYKEIQWTIYYIACIKGVNINDGRLGLVPFYYEKAMEHFRIVERNRMATYNEEIPKEITIVRGQREDGRKRLDKTRYIDITSIY